MVDRKYMSGTVHLKVNRERRGRKGGRDLEIDVTFRGMP